MNRRFGGMTAAFLIAGVFFWEATAAEAVDLGRMPTECEIQAALLGAAGPGCPPEPRPAAVPAPPPAVESAPAAPHPPVVRSADFRIEFAFASAEIRRESLPALDRLASVMNAPGSLGIRFRVVGHTDAVGSDTANLTLSLKRAVSVRDYLVKTRGVAENRLDVEGRGRSRLADPAHPKAAINRRVEVINLGS